MSAITVAKDVFAKRRIGADQLPAASPTLLPLDKAAEAKRAAGVEQQFGKLAPTIVQYTTDVLSVTFGCVLTLLPGIEVW